MKRTVIAAVVSTAASAALMFAPAHAQQKVRIKR
jgi:hypothetical protein